MVRLHGQEPGDVGQEAGEVVLGVEEHLISSQARGYLIKSKLKISFFDILNRIAKLVLMEINNFLELSKIWPQAQQFRQAEDTGGEEDGELVIPGDGLADSQG